MGITTDALFTAVDVHYLDDGNARAALVAAHERGFSRVAWTQAAVVPAGAPYVPGEFYLREMPPLRAVGIDMENPRARSVGRARGLACGPRMTGYRPRARPAGRGSPSQWSM
jgi:hypothetical protein